MLAGDYTVLPIRYGTGRRSITIKDSQNQDSSIYVDWPIPSDLYFSDFNGNWNVDGDSSYGEFESSEMYTMDYAPEIFVGRLLCTNRQEIANYTEKLIRYERNPGNGDYGYLQKAFYCQSDEMQENENAKTIKSAWGDIFSYSKTMQEDPGPYDSITVAPTGNK